MADSTVHRGRPRSVEADRAIADATVQLLGEHGWAGLTMNGVAQRAGVSTATLYRRYSCKEDLVCASVKTRYEAQPQVDTGTLEGDLRARLLSIVERIRSDGGKAFEGLIGEAARNPRLRDLLRSSVFTAGRADLRRIIERAVARGEIAQPADVEVAVNLVDGPLFHRVLVTGGPLTPRLVDELVPMLLGALGYSG